MIDEKFALFQNYFANPEMQENIRNAKEEQFQEGFLRELFVAIFGYTLNTEPNFNLTTELKNTNNSKKADSAILKGDEAIAVIELKGTLCTVFIIDRSCIFITSIIRFPGKSRSGIILIINFSMIPIVIIAHRLNTIENADVIYFVNSGNVTRAGSLKDEVNMLMKGKIAR